MRLYMIIQAIGVAYTRAQGFGKMEKVLVETISTAGGPELAVDYLAVVVEDVPGDALQVEQLAQCPIRIAQRGAVVLENLARLGPVKAVVAAWKLDLA
jgi:hypothetical protein